MPAQRGVVARVGHAVRKALAPIDGGVVLAVSGGRDSMVLLDASLALRDRIRAVATFDHGTGEHAAHAAALVREVAAGHALRVIEGRADVAGSGAGATEADWRDARWAFLRAAAAAVGAVAVATAHSSDDQVETVVLRVMRGAGARGLASLAAPDPRIVRPLLGVTRSELGEYAEARELRWTDDPANADRRHARVRARCELLPALERARPGLSAALLRVGQAAAGWRVDVDRWLAEIEGGSPIGHGDSATAERRVFAQDRCVPVVALAGYAPAALATFWPAFAAGAGVRLDRRATARLVSFTQQALELVAGGRVQPARVPVAGGGEVRLVPVAPAGGGRRAWSLVVGPPRGRGGGVRAAA